MILYAPLAVGITLARPWRPVPALLVILAVTGAYLAQNAASLLVRRRGSETTGRWLGIYTALLAAGGLPLLFWFHRTPLLLWGGLAGTLFAVHSWLLTLPLGRRLDRTAWGQVLAVGSLTLTGPVGYTAV